MQTKSQFKVLKVLHDCKCTNEIKSYKIDKIMESTTLSKNTVRKCLKYLKEQEYVKEGALSHKAKSYYVTQKGILKMEELKK